MFSTTLLIGTENASDLRSSSDLFVPALESRPVRTTGDVLARQQEKLTRTLLAMQRTTCGLLGHYHSQPGDQILLDAVDARRRGFRPFLEGRRYTENSIRTFVYQQRVLLRTARRYGWEHDASIPEDWN